MGEYISLILAFMFCAAVIWGMIFAIRGAYKKDKREILKVIAYFLVGMITIKGFPVGYLVLLYILIINRGIELTREKIVAPLCGMFAVQAFDFMSTFIRSRVL